MRPRGRDLRLAAASAVLVVAGCAGPPGPGESPTPGQSPGAFRTTFIPSVAPLGDQTRAATLDRHIDAADIVTPGATRRFAPR